MASYFGSYEIISLHPSSTSGSTGQGVNSVQRQSTDPLFWASLLLQNIVTGSAYWIAQTSDLSNVLAAGSAPGGDFSITSIPSIEENMLVTIRVRKGTAGGKYFPFETQAQIKRTGGVCYVIQTPDPIAL